MKSRPAIVVAVSVALALTVSLFPPVVEWMSPKTGLTRSFFALPAFGGPPVESQTTEISLRFLDDAPDLPRQQISARWRGFFFLSRPQTVEFFAGGNDEVELRVDGELVLSRNLREGTRTQGRRIALDAGAHQLSVDFQQFSGGMALNIQRALEGQAPTPFLATELFRDRVEARHVRMLSAARWVRRITPYMWAGVIVLFVGTFAALNYRTWRTTTAPRSAREYAGRLWLVAATSLLAPAIVFILGPHTIFANNPGEFAVPFGQLAAPWLLRSAATNWLILFAPGCVIAVLSERATRVYAAVLLAIGLTLWGQGNLWNADYGVLAGRDVDLAEHAARAPYEIAGFGAVLVAAVAFYRPISRVAPFAALVFIGLQAVGAAATSAGPAADRARWIEPPPEIYQFSPSRNVIHIVLDEFQSDVFTEILQQDRAELDSRFSGFVYFADHTGAFPTTSMSMPAMLTGMEYRNQKHAPEFVREAFKDSSIFEKVSRAGYDVDAMSIVPIASFEEWIGPETAPNWKGSRFRIRKPFISQGDYREVSARQLGELSLFRHVPHSLKELSVKRPGAFYRPIWMDRGDTPAQIRRHEASNSVAFLEHFAGLMSLGRDRPVYKLIHVGVPHRPVVVDRICQFIGPTDMSRESYTAQSRCAVKLVAALLDRARALGIYDSSLIIVSSDHGTDLNPLGFNGKSDSLSLVPGPSTSRLPATVGSAKAIMFIKPPQATGPISISEAPTTHIDLQPTILDILELPGGSPGTSMLERDPKQPRRRTYGMYDPRQRFPKEYLDRIDVLSIDGRSTDAASWHVQRSIWNPNARLDARDIDVGPREAHRYLGPGWSFEQREHASGGDEVTFARPATPKAVIFASLPAGAVELVLRASTSAGPASAVVRVVVDGRETARLEVEGAAYRDYPVRIPADSARPSISEITLHLEGDRDETPVFKLDRLTIRER
ncbi:MAG: hypothetical protein EHM55_08965 [Acidobacteria bacterium]|nr:MAG: hypothetical protein EHM55_08965 [Acidobacteriota bacterium]